jgi:mono/diheme cytochrome c family protein
MKAWCPTVVLFVAGGVGLVFADETAVRGSKAPDRGAEAVRGRPAMNPAWWTRAAYDKVWKQWGLVEKPADYDRAFRERYGLHQAPYDNHGLPMGLHQANGLLGKGIATDCLLCHGGAVAGQTVIGLGSSSVDVQGLFEEMFAADGLAVKFPRFSDVRGSIDPVAVILSTIESRDPEMNLRAKPVRLGPIRTSLSTPPAWWLLKKKKTRDWTGAIGARALRINMTNILHPFNSGPYVKKQEPIFADMLAFMLSVEPPKYPFPIDRSLAARGQEVFAQTCVRCHGTYGPGGRYPNKIVDLDTLGTDAALAEAFTPKLVEYFNGGWLAREVGPDGQPYRFAAHHGYQAPPLDGVWATAPYLHNGSVPTVYHVLNSKARPAVFTRSYGTGKEDYDPVRLGQRFQILERSPNATRPAAERRKVYDTRQDAHGNAGHTFGDKLTEDERLAVIEYLKTL